MLNRICFLLAFSLYMTQLAHGQRIVGDCTINYDVYFPQDSGQGRPPVVKANKITYLKGKMVRTDVTGAGYSQTVIFNGNANTATVLKNLGKEKYVTYLDSLKWKLRNKRFENVTTSFLNEEKIILGYRCRKAISRLADGSEFDLFYTVDMVPTIQENTYQFDNIPGFVLEYEAFVGDPATKIFFSAVRINLFPVPSALFNPSLRGYRQLSE